MADSKTLQIRNSTIDFLTFTRQSGEESIEVRVQDNDVWLTQASIAKLFGVDRSVITKHLKSVFEDGEVEESSVCANFAQTADDGKTYKYKFYGLKAVIAVGYKVNSQAAVEFRQWATRVLETFAKQGYVLDKQRLMIILQKVRQQRTSLQLYKIKCTTLFTEILLRKLLKCIWTMQIARLAAIFQ